MTNKLHGSSEPTNWEVKGQTYVLRDIDEDVSTCLQHVRWWTKSKPSLVQNIYQNK